MAIAKNQKRSVKARAMSLVRSLPNDSSWEDLMYRIYVRQKIETGLTDIRTGRVHSHESIRREFGLEP